MSPELFFLILALGLIATELLVLQFSAFWFLFFGIGALTASLAVLLFPAMGWYGASAIFLVDSVLSGFILYPLLKKWQNKPTGLAGHDAIGQRVRVMQTIAPNLEGKVVWSGSDWPARMDDNGGDEALEVGDEAIIKRLEGIRLIVARS